MPRSFRGARLALLTAILCVGGCLVETDDDDLDTDESSVIDEGGDIGVTISADVQECRTTCDDSYQQCGVRCVNDQPCVSGCETKKGECYTDCD